MCVHTSEENETIAESNSPARASAESAIRLYLYFYTFYQRTRARGARRGARARAGRRTRVARRVAAGDKLCRAPNLLIVFSTEQPSPDVPRAHMRQRARPDMCAVSHFAHTAHSRNARHATDHTTLAQQSSHRITDDPSSGVNGHCH